MNLKFQATKIKYQYQQTEDEVDCTIGFLGWRYKNGVFKIVFTDLSDESDKEESKSNKEDAYEGFEYDIIRAIADSTALTPCDASIEGRYFRGS